MASNLQSIKDKFSKTSVLVIGDLVADQFLHGTITRVSREAPVFILRHDETETLPGGAANAALNVATLGGNSRLLGFVGDDTAGSSLLEKLRNHRVNCDHVFVFEKTRTTTKVRVLGGEQYSPRRQVIRIDYENAAQLPKDRELRLLEVLDEASREVNVIVFSDYNYGVASKAIFAAAKEIAGRRGIPLIVDSRFRLRDFAGATSATPNQDEVEQLVGNNFTSDDCELLREQLGLATLLVTRGNKGMSLFEKDFPARNFGSIGAKDAIDVTGAGDTVIAAYSLSIGAGLYFSDAANVANHAGGIVVMKKGTASVSIDELLSSLENSPKDLSAAK